MLQRKTSSTLQHVKRGSNLNAAASIRTYTYNDLPCHPGVQVHSPVRGLHCAPLRHGQSFPQSSPHFPGGQAKKRKEGNFLSYPSSCMLFRRQISLHYLAKKRGSSPTKKALLSAAFFVTNFPFRPFLHRSLWYLLVIGFRAKFDLCTPQRAFLNSFELLMIFAATLTITLYVRLGDVDFKQTESISLIGR